MSLLLFDIDATLLLSGGVGVRAMTRAFTDLFAVPEAFASSDIAGRTDTFILSQALLRAGLPDTAENHARFRDAYVATLREEILRSPKGRYGLMPGVAELLAAVHDDERFHLALLTGNFEPAAFIKLSLFAIDGYFAWGAFGEESRRREDLARAAMQRATDRGVPAQVRDRAIVIGDTPHDVACARAVGARVLAVATGSYSVEALTAAGADHVMADLSDTDRVVELLL